MDVGPEVADALLSALRFCASSSGTTDITCGGLARLWDWRAGRVPDPSLVRHALAHVGWQKLHVEGTLAWRTDRETLVTLGATAKGWIADRLVSVLRSGGVACGVVNLGDNVALVGARPGARSWDVTLASPFDKSRASAVLLLRDCCAVTSGVGERAFVRDGRAYHHVLDMRTGEPTTSDTASVTVVSRDATTGDGMSTTLLCLGSSRGIQMVEETPGVDALFVLADGTMRASSGLFAAKPVIALGFASQGPVPAWACSVD